MNFRKILLLIILSAFSITATFGQTTIVELDTLTLSPSGALPFDDPFILKIPVKTDQVTSAGYIRKNGSKPINPRLFYVKKQGIQNYLFIHIEDPDLLDPGRNYSFFWTEGVNDDVQEAFDNYHLYIKNKDLAAFKKAKTIILAIAAANLSKMGMVVIFDPKDVQLKTLDGFYHDAKSNFPAKYDDYNTKLGAYLPNHVNNAFLNGGLNNFVKAITEKSNDFDPALKSAYFKDVRLAMSRLVTLNSITPAAYQDLIYGINSIDCNKCQATKTLDFDGRLINIKSTIAALAELYTVANALHTVAGMPAEAIILKNTIAEFDAAQTSLKVVADARKSITKLIADIGISNFNSVGGTTNIKSFDTRTKFSIAPDFGVVTTRLFKDKANPYSFVPYLGFHVNFRPLNRDIAWRTYHHKPISYLSAFVGWSLVNIKNGPHLTSKADSVTGFFTGEKGTLMTGLGFRLGNAVRITTGAMYYFKYSSDAINPSFYGKRQLKAWPFVGLSLDLALKDLLNGISDVFTAAPRTYNPPPLTAATTSN